MHDISLQRGRGLYLNDKCILKHPTLGEIEEIDYDKYVLGEVKDYGYNKYNQMLYSLILSSKDLADILWFENQVWYEDIENEWEFFIQRALCEAKPLQVKIELNTEQEYSIALAVRGNIKEALNYFLNMSGEFIFVQKEIENSTKMQTILFNVQEKIEENNQTYYIIKEDCLKFTEYYYLLIVDYLKKINWINIDYDFTRGGSRNAKIYILKQTYKKRKKNKKNNIDISTINSALTAKNLNTWAMPIYSFYECYYRLVKFDEYQNTMSALYSGGIDTKKNPVNWEKINWASIINI